MEQNGSPGLLGEQHLTVLQHIFWIRPQADTTFVEQHSGAGLIDQVGMAEGGVWIEGGQGVVGINQIVVIVGPQLEFVALLDRPGRVDIRLGEPDADDRDAQGEELVVAVAVPATIGQSASGSGVAKEPDDAWIAGEMLRTTGDTVAVGGGEGGQRDGRGGIGAVEAAA